MISPSQRALAGGLTLAGLGFFGFAFCGEQFGARPSDPQALAPQARTGEPETEEAEPEPEEYALGSLNLGLLTAAEPRAASFSGRNTSEQAWTVKRVWPDCGCVTVLEHPERVEPGDAFEIRFSIDPRSLTRSSVEKNISMLVDPPGAILVGHLEADVLANPYFEPQGVVRRVEEGTSRWTQEVVLRTPRTGARAEVAFVSVPDGFDVQQGAWREAEDQLELPLSISGSMDLDLSELVRTLRVSIRDWTPNGADELEIDLPIYLLRRPALLASPSALDLLPGPGGDLPELARVSIDGDFEALSARVVPAALEAVLAPRIVDRQLVVATSDLEPGTRAEIVLTRQDGHSLSLPVRVL